MLRLRAEVSAEGNLITGGDEGYRLIVQSFANATVANDDLPHPSAKPLASTQRAVTKEELERGISVDVVALADEIADEDKLVIAWVERGDPDLEYDALRARPLPGAVYGVSRCDRDATQIVLSRQVA